MGVTNSISKSKGFFLFFLHFLRLSSHFLWFQYNSTLNMFIFYSIFVFVFSLYSSYSTQKFPFTHNSKIVFFFSSFLPVLLSFVFLLFSIRRADMIQCQFLSFYFEKKKFTDDFFFFFRFQLIFSFNFFAQSVTR